jgi:hypothetical protein
MIKGTPVLRLLGVCSVSLVLTCADETVGCLGSGDPTCVPPSPCEGVTYSCSATRVRVARFGSGDRRASGLDALAALNDIVLENDLVTAVIDDIDHPHHLAASGGNLVDLSPRGGSDHLNAVYAVTGILPRDAVRYQTLEMVQSAGYAAVIARGVLDGDARSTVTTRYELRPCDPGVRIRTEVYNGSRSTMAWFLSDVWYWGDRSMTPFVPIARKGFVHPSLNLLEPDASWAITPWMAAASHATPNTSYAVVSCTRPSLEGIQDSTVSAVGLPRSLVRPGDGQVYERFIFAAPGGGIAGAQSLAVEAHAILHNESVTEVIGRVVDTSGTAVGGDERTASVVLYEPSSSSPDDSLAGTQWSQIVPESDGRFRAVVPSGKTLRAQVHRFGRAQVTSQPVTLTGAQTNFGDIVLPAPPGLTVTVQDGDSMQPLHAEVVLVPVENVTPRETVTGSLHGVSAGLCAPFLGAPHGASPACNRALAFSGTTTFPAPAGTYWVYVTAGPAFTLARERVELRPGVSTSVNLQLRRIPNLYPEGSLTGDFHVHGGRSFDSPFPDRDRVQSFVTAGVDVIVATDHDVCTSYQEAVRTLNLGNEVTVISGVEATPLIPFLRPPGDSFPRVVGHFIFWPMPYDPNHFNNGMPWDERAEPGQLFDRMRTHIGEQGVMQLNHPTAESKAGRNEGYLRMLKFDPRQGLPARDDGTAIGMIWRRPGGQNGLRNVDFHTQEALNGSGVVNNLGYRDAWFAVLNRGLLRAGTANSDSHSLTEEQLGYPRNVVLGTFDRTRIDLTAFNRAVRAGNMVGTNGPYIAARIVLPDGAHGPGIEPLTVSAGAMLEVEVRAAPWIPVTEVRFVVNGRVVRTIRGSDVMSPSDPLGTDGVVRWRGSVSVSELVGPRDGWIVVEAGMAVPTTRDEDNNGLVDHIDGDGDGEADDERMLRATEQDPRFHIDTISPGTLPMAFTNPFVIDIDGNGWRAPQ